MPRPVGLRMVLQRPRAMVQLRVPPRPRRRMNPTAPLQLHPTASCNPMMQRSLWTQLLPMSLLQSMAWRRFATTSCFCWNPSRGSRLSSTVC